MSWDAPAAAKGSCAACSRLETWSKGERGPVKTPLVMTEVYYFRFCGECLTGSRRDDKWLVITTGPSTGHRWFVG